MKKIIMFIITVIMCTALCSCGEATQSSDSENRLLAIQMKLDVNKACISLYDSNHAVIKSIDATNSEDGISYFNEALNLVKDSKTKVDCAISSPNFISEGLEELEENYEKTISLLQKHSGFYVEETEEIVSLVVEGSDQHLLLLKAIDAFANLYEIREFDQLPDDEAQSSLKDNWWKFGFKEDIECPESIDKEELYLIWGAQYFEEFDQDEFLQELQTLRENDDLSSKDCNKKWAEFIENFIFNTEDHSNDVAMVFFNMVGTAERQMDVTPESAVTKVSYF
ncbi:MAG: hypothetical protein K2H53_03930 [Clostridia bacterium]|nr:hypothetical protein [Clostridia bacterium]